MTTRMIHPQHGATHAYGQGDIDRLKGHGWLVEDEISVPAVESSAAEALKDALSESIRLDPPPKWSASADPADIPVEWVAPAKRKPGRPPKAK